MKTPHSLTRLAGSLALLAAGSVATGASAQVPVIEARFNESTSVNLKNGALVGPAKSGVSGKADDLSYVGNTTAFVTAKQDGPAAMLANTNEVQGVDEFTITAWYKVDGTLAGDATLFSLAGTVLIFDAKSARWTLRVDARTADGKTPTHWFTTSDKPPHYGWATPDAWIFIAMVWKKAEKKVTFYQGGNPFAATVDKQVTRSEEVDPVSEKFAAPRVIGNSSGPKKDRPFSGSIDDLRYYSKALDAAAIEKIHAADLENQAVTLP